MGNKVIIKYGGTSGLPVTATKIKKMCDKAVYNYSLTSRFVAELYKTQKICNKAVGTILLQCNLLLIATRHKKCMVNLLTLVLLYLIQCQTEM